MASALRTTLSLISRRFQGRWFCGGCSCSPTSSTSLVVWPSIFNNHRWWFGSSGFNNQGEIYHSFHPPPLLQHDQPSFDFLGFVVCKGCSGCRCWFLFGWLLHIWFPCRFACFTIQFCKDWPTLVVAVFKQSYSVS